jgi:hypothetical protein
MSVQIALLPVASCCLNALTPERCELPRVASSCCLLPDVASSKRHALSMITALSAEFAAAG